MFAILCQDRITLVTDNQDKHTSHIIPNETAGYLCRDHVYYIPKFKPNNIDKIKEIVQNNLSKIKYNI